MRVDIIIPNFNKGEFLASAINSVIQQSYKNWRLYIIDDCSTDNSRNILKKYNKYKKIKILYLNKRRGPGYCRNLGIKKSNSTFISFLDSDDYWKKNKLKNQMNIIIKKKLRFAYSDYYSFFQKEKKNSYIKSNVPKIFTFKNFLFNSSINTSTLILKRDVINKIKFRNLLQHEDYIFKCEILKKNKNLKAIKTDYVDVFYRIGESSRSKGKLKSLYYLWKYNGIFNKLNFIDNFLSVIFISYNSLRKYGFKK
tara:strand:+ start:324 stop:1082 length:759 start_codon:yes stop_codon:yes gene_type:complete